MNYQVVPKDADLTAIPTGEDYKLYLDLKKLHEERPDKKLVIEFRNSSSGLRAKDRIAAWAYADGLELHTASIKGTKKRQMFLEKVAE